MIRCLAYAFSAIFKSRARLVADNLCLRQQLVVLKRRQTYRTRQAADVEDAQLVRNITLKVMRQLLNAEDLPGG